LRELTEAERRRLQRTDWASCTRMRAKACALNVSAGANVGERLIGHRLASLRAYRETAQDWLERVEIDPSRIDETPRSFSAAMRQRLQIAKNLVTHRDSSSWTKPTAARRLGAGAPPRPHPRARRGSRPRRRDRDA